MRQTMQSRRFAHCEKLGWIVSAYGIAVAHGYEGTEREFALTLLGRDGIDLLPMLLVTDADEADISEDYEAVMRPSSAEYAYESEVGRRPTPKNDFLAADQSTPIPDALTVNGRSVRLSCEGTAFGNAAELPASSLPAVTAADDGKILKVVDGAWAAGASA